MWRIGRIWWCRSSIARQTCEVVVTVSPLTSQTVAASTVIVVIVLTAAHPTLATCIIFGAIGEPDYLLVTTCVTRVFGITTPADAILVI